MAASFRKYFCFEALVRAEKYYWPINFFPAFIIGENIGDLLSARNAKEVKLLSKFAKLQKLSVEELVLRFLDLLLKWFLGFIF